MKEAALLFFFYLTLVCFQLYSSVNVNLLTPIDASIFLVADLCPTNGLVLLFVVEFYLEDLYNKGRGAFDFIDLITALYIFPNSAIVSLFMFA